MKTKKGTTKVKAKTKAKSKPQQPKAVQENKGSNHLLLATLALSAAGVAGYFGWEHFFGKKNKAGLIPNSYKPPKSLPAKDSLPSVDNGYHADTVKKGSTKTTYSAEFPLKRGSKGDKVKKLQQALIGKYGASILPKYGADGDFGMETAKALTKAGLPATISESAYNVFVNSSGVTHDKLAEQLHEAASDGNFTTAIKLLKQIEHKDDYEQVSNSFKELRLGGVHQTLVNGMLNSFSSEDQKQQIRFEFVRMGLQYDGSKWSLSGLGSVPIITVEPATVWVDAKNSVQVPARMVLGSEVAKKLDFTLFENNGKYFLVRTSSVKHLQ